MKLDATIRRYEKTTDPQKRRLIALDIALSLHDANQDPAEWWRRHAADRLQQFDEPNNLFKNFLKVSAWACCDACQTVHGKSFDLKTAQASGLLPQACCTNQTNKAGFSSCACDWEIDMEALRVARASREPAKHELLIRN